MPDEPQQDHIIRMLEVTYDVLDGRIGELAKEASYLFKLLPVQGSMKQPIGSCSAGIDRPKLNQVTFVSHRLDETLLYTTFVPKQWPNPRKGY
jgi:hypothetical protein